MAHGVETKYPQNAFVVWELTALSQTKSLATALYYYEVYVTAIKLRCVHCHVIMCILRMHVGWL